MSASPIARQACGMTIPQRKVLITDASQLPEVYSSTPGGTIFSTTPGGTRIVYERAFLMNLKNSPLSRTPPKNIPSHLLKGEPAVRCMNPVITHSNGNKAKSPQQTKTSPSKPVDDHDDQFDMDL